MASRLKFGVAWTLGSWLGLALGIFGTFALVAIGLGLLVDDVDAVMSSQRSFALALAAGFAAGAALMGLAQWLLLRRDLPGLSRWWIGGWAVGFAVAALLYAALDDRIPTLANELLHNVAGGAIAGALHWRFALRDRAPGARWWTFVPAGAFLLGGLVNWGIESATGPDGPAMPIAMLTMAVATAFAGARLVHEVAAARPPRAEPILRAA